MSRKETYQEKEHYQDNNLNQDQDRNKPCFTVKLSSKVPMTPGQHYNDGDEEKVEGGQGQYDWVLPL